MATGLIERMREDNTLLNASERFPLFLNDHFIEYVPIKDALKECDILFLDDALAHANDVLARNAEVFPKGMPKDCAIAVLLYTYENCCANKVENICRTVNRVLQYGPPEDLYKWKNYILLLLKGIRCLCKVNTTVFRVIDKLCYSPERFQQDQTIIWNSFSSCTLSKSLALAAVKDPSNSVLFCVNTSECRSLGDLTFTKEPEVVFEPGATFVVTSCINESVRVVNLQQKILNPTDSSTHLANMLEVMVVLQSYCAHQFSITNSACLVLLEQHSTATALFHLIMFIMQQEMPACIDCTKYKQHCLKDKIFLASVGELRSILKNMAQVPDFKNICELLLGLCFEKGIGGARDEEAACKVYVSVADKGNINAQYLLGLCYLHAIGVPKDSMEGARLIALSARQGHASAQYNLGLCFFNAVGVDINPQEAVKFFSLASNQGHVEAHFSLGMCYLVGVGITQDKSEAVRLLTFAAENGHANAQHHLAMCYLEGVVPQKGPKEAVRLLTPISQQGRASSQFLLGSCYKDGKGVQKDLQEAVKLFWLAAQQGYPPAQCELAFCMLQGLGIAKDEQQAFRLLQQSASYANSQFNLGLCYVRGIGVAKDTKEAARFFTLASEQGLAEAHCDLGLCFNHGVGVSKDKKEAVRLITLAAENGNARAKIRIAKLRKFGV